MKPILSSTLTQEIFMYRFISLTIAASLFSFTALADCSTCKGHCDQANINNAEQLIQTSVDIDLEDSIILGQKEAEHTIVFYTDAECSFCHKAYQNLQVLRDKWQDRLNIVVKQSPMNHHQTAKEIARYSLALRNQGESIASQFTEHLYQNPKSIHAGVVHWNELAQNFNADLEQLELDLKDPETDNKLASELEMARSLGVKGTPSFVIAGQLIVGNRSVEELEGYFSPTLSEI
jgi:predicted DsbA family dithiol-disulfide isomerase